MLSKEERIHIELEKHLSQLPFWQHPSAITIALMAWIRLLLELKKKKRDYAVVNFYANWVLHEGISHESNRWFFDSFLENAEKEIINDEKSLLSKGMFPLTDEKRQMYHLRNLISLVHLNSFKSQLSDFLIAEQLPTELINNKKMWQVFKNSMIDALSMASLTFNYSPKNNQIAYRIVKATILYPDIYDMQSVNPLTYVADLSVEMANGNHHSVHLLDATQMPT